MTLLARQIYVLPARGIALDWDVELELAQKRIYHICGENGLGKTSFMEQVLIPALRTQGVPYLHLGQDMGTQLYTLRASLAVAGHGLGHLSEIDLLTTWVRQGKQARIFLLDEFDKYYPDHDFIFQASRDFVNTYVFISHQAQVCTLEDLPGFELERITFERAAPTLPTEGESCYAQVRATVIAP